MKLAEFEEQVIEARLALEQQLDEGERHHRVLIGAAVDEFREQVIALLVEQYDLDADELRPFCTAYNNDWDRIIDGRAVVNSVRLHIEVPEHEMISLSACKGARGQVKIEFDWYKVGDVRFTDLGQALVSAAEQYQQRMGGVEDEPVQPSELETAADDELMNALRGDDVAQALLRAFVAVQRERV